MMHLHADLALLPGGWTRDVGVTVDQGRIAAIQPGTAPQGRRVGILLPAPANLHSHTFQRVMAGLTEARTAGHDSFWTWRALMYRCLDRLTPEDVQAVAAFAMMEMAEAGFAAVAEFHYLHHAPGGAGYDDLAEMSARIAAAAADSGLGLTLLPVLYQRGGCDGRALAAGQLRFGCDAARFGRLWQGAAAAVGHLPPDAAIGVAPHSLRAVGPEALAFAASLAPDGPLHLHIAEQEAEVAEVMAHLGARPVAWLLDSFEVTPRWCLVHATQMVPAETAALAATGAVAGLCPVTEANLGDGIFDAPDYLAAGGAFGVGTDSNVRIALAEELRTLEYSQRLHRRGRAILASAERSTGRVLYEGALAGGAQAAGRAAGAIRLGAWADLMALDPGHVDLAGRQGDAILDSLVFATADRAITDVWSAGRHLVAEGRHLRRDAITAAYRATLARLGEVL